VNHTAIDLSSLSWILPELDRSFTAVRHHLSSAYNAVAQSTDNTVTHLIAAKHSIHDAAGALQVIDAQGLVHYVMCLEQAIDYHIDSQSLTQTNYIALDEACYALIAYLNELQTQHTPLQPTCLFVYYEAVRLLTANVSTSAVPNIHPVDLYFPNLSGRLKRLEQEATTPFDLDKHKVINYAKLRTVYEKLMLLIFTDKATQKEFDNLALLMLLIANHSTHSYEYSFWKSCETVFLILPRTPVANRTLIKRWIARLNMHLQSLMMGASHVSERLFREALYFIAIDTENVSNPASIGNQLTEYANAVYTQVVNTYSLAHSTVSDIHTKRYGVAPPINNIELINTLTAFKTMWDESFPNSLESEGIQVTASTLHRRLRTAIQYAIELRDKLNQHQLTTLASVINSIIQTSHQLNQEQKFPKESFGLEGAQAILWVEETLKKPGQLHSTLNKKSEALSQRILLSNTMATPLPLPQSENKLNEQVLLSDVVHQILISLSAVEKSLEGAFKQALHTGTFSNTSTVLDSLSQIKSTSGLLNLPVIEQSFTAIYNRLTSLFSQQAKPTEDEILAFALRFSQITNLLDVFVHNPARAQQTFMFDHQTEKIVELNSTDKVNQNEAISPVNTSNATSTLKTVDSKALSPENLLQTPTQVSHTSTPEQAIDTAEDTVLTVKPVQYIPSEKVASHESELYAIFIEEAREVLINIRTDLNTLEYDSEKMSIVKNIRRHFHTLKGSSRTVGFKEFGDAACVVETFINEFLTQHHEVNSKDETTLLEVMRYSQELLTIWLEELDECLLILDTPENKLNDNAIPSTSFKTNSNLEQFSRSLQPYLTPFEATDSTENTEQPTSNNFSENTNQTDNINQIDLNITTLQSSLILPSVPSPSIETLSIEESRIEEDFSNEFIKAARQAVLQARTVQRKTVSSNTSEPVLLQPVKILHRDSNNKLALDTFSMVNIGPLRLSKQLFLLYIQETQQHLNALRVELECYEQETKNHIAVINPLSESPQIPTTTASLFEAYRYAHSIRGSSATIGLLALKDIASPIEALLNHACQNELILMPYDLRCLLNAVSDMTQDLTLFSCETYPNIRQSTVAMLNQLLEDSTHTPRIIRHFSNHSATKAALFNEQSIHQTALSLNPDAAINSNQNERVISDDLTEFLDIEVIDLDRSNFVPSPESKTNIQTELDDQTPEPAIQIDIDEDDSSHIDNIDPDIWQDLLEETETLIPNTQTALNSAATQLDALTSVRRNLHTLKGCFRMAGAMRLGAMVHALESKIEQYAQPSSPFLSTDIHLKLIDYYDDITLHFERLKQAAQTPPSPTSHVVPISQSEISPKQAFIPPQFNPVSNFSSVDVKLPTLRIRMDTLNNLVNQVTEVSSTKGRLDRHILNLRSSLLDLTDNVERLRKQIRELEIQGDTQIAARVDSKAIASSEFDPLEFDRFTRFQELTRMLSESLNDLLAVRDAVSKTLIEAERDLIQQSKSTKELTRALMHSRLIAFDAIADRLYRVIRQSAKEQGKQVRLDLIGGTLMLDRSILEQISGSLEHLVRNSIAHGIELPQDRLNAHKPAQGTITVKITQQGNELEITLNDDGAGLNLTKIHQLGLQKGLISPHITPTTAQLADLIFVPGFTTVQHVTELSGRGIGMDVVRSDIVGLGGRIALHTVPQQGTTFTMRIPLTLAINQVLMVTAHQVSYAIPSALIQKVVSLKLAELTQAYQHGYVQIDEINYPFAHLTQLMGETIHPPSQTTALVLLLSNGNITAAIHVDSVQNNVEAVIKPLSPFMRRIPGLISATLLGDGNLCLIVDPIQLLQAYNHKAHDAVISPVMATHTAPVQATADPFTPTPTNQTSTTVDTPEKTNLPAKTPSNRLVMVVDDSLTVRKVTQKLLLREGWEVVLAKDGIDALEQLQTVQPSLMIVDIEMPRMDGFDLTRNIRAEARFMHIPIIMITSRIADKHREYAMDLGVNVYMGKPYHDEALLSAMSDLVA
jgi:chemosensory pili system protein ChpA (sensor histidine kinase/response regulator)